MSTKDEAPAAPAAEPAPAPAPAPEPESAPKVEEDIPIVSKDPVQIYCLKCKKPRVVLKPRKHVTRFESRKTHTPMRRLADVGECSICHSRVSRFAKQDPAVTAATTEPDGAKSK